MHDRPLGWGVIGTGGIASEFCQALTRSRRCRVVNVAGSSPDKARAFATRGDIDASSDDVAQLLADPAVGAVYIASPHPCHEQHPIACIDRRQTGAVRKAGEDGTIVLPNPWIPRGNRHGTVTEMTIYRDGHEPEHIVVRTDLATYAIEAEFVRDSLPATEPAWPAMGHADTLGNIRVLEAWRAALNGERVSDPSAYSQEE